MILPLQTLVASSVNITSATTVGSFSSATRLRARGVLRLLRLNGAAATITAYVRNTTDGADVAAATSVTKRLTTDTAVSIQIPEFDVVPFKTYGLLIQSTNASDTSVTWVVDWENVSADALSIALGGGVSDASGASAVYNRSKTLPFFLAALYERVAFVGIGDSNQVKDGYGWQGGFQYALSTLAPVWSTGLIPCNNTIGQSLGYFHTLTTTAANSGAPSGLDSLMPVPGVGLGGTTPGYAYTASGTSDLILYVKKAFPGLAGNIRVHLGYGVSSGWNGSFTLGGRYNGDGYNGYNTLPAFAPASASISTSGTASAIVDMSWDWAATTLTGFDSLELCFSTGSNRNGLSSGPVFFSYFQIEQRDIHSGYSSQTLGFHGGNPTRQMLIDLQGMGVAGLAEYFRQATLYAGPNKYCAVRINEGFNDRNDGGNPSWNPATSDFTGPDSATQAGFANNTQGIINLLKSAWAAAGLPASSLYFVLTVSHPQSLPDDSQLVSYRAAADSVSDTNDRTCSVHLDQLTSFAEISKNSWYEDVTPSPHMVSAGYNAVATYELKALQPIGSEVVADANTRSFSAQGYTPTRSANLDNVGKVMREDFPSDGSLSTFTVGASPAVALTIQPESIVQSLAIFVEAGNGNTADAYVSINGYKTLQSPAISLQDEITLNPGQTHQAFNVSGSYAKYEVLAWGSAGDTVSVQASTTVR